MKKFLLLSTALLLMLAASLKAQSILFQPDLSSGLIGANAFSDSTDPAAQISGSTNNGLHFVRDGHSIGIIKSGLPAEANNHCLLVKFDLTVESCDAGNGTGKAITLELGDHLSNTGSPTGTMGNNNYARLAIVTSKNHLTAQFYDWVAEEKNTQGAMDASTPLTVQWVVNKSGMAASYTAPGGTTASVAAGHCDVWAGNTLIFDDMDVVNAANDINAFKISSSLGTAVFDVDNLVISTTSDNTGLPLKLTGFTAARSRGAVLLQWQATGALNSSYFLVTRSVDGIHFSPVGKKMAVADGNNTMHSYTYTDANPGDSENLYQLTMTDRDGKISKSQIVKATTARLSEVLMYPNPATAFIKIDNAVGDIEIYDITGRLVLVKPATGGISEINIQALATGLYFVKTEKGYGRFIKK